MGVTPCSSPRFAMLSGLCSTPTISPLSINIEWPHNCLKIMISSWWLHSVLIWAVMISNLVILSSAKEDTKIINDAQKQRDLSAQHYVMGRRVGIESDNDIDTTTRFVTATGNSIEDTTVPLQSKEPIGDVFSLYDEEVNNGERLSDPNYGTIRGAATQQHRRTEDLEDMLNGMANKSPEDWEPEEWILMILFLSFFGWLGCCLCTLCCCGSRSPNICAYICFWELCCRGGSDIDRCCDYALT